MKATITDVKFINEFEGKHGTLYSFSVSYDGKKAYYNSKSKDQTKFIVGQEAEFSEEKRTGKKGEYLVIKPEYQNKGYSQYGKAKKKEQSRYSGFAVSYAKDLVVNGRIDIKELPEYATVLFDLMVELDKTLES